MKHTRQGRLVRTPDPVLGSYGILDERKTCWAWKTVAKPFAELGFTLLRQLGMGEFGRVYEALNDKQSRLSGARRAQGRPHRRQKEEGDFGGGGSHARRPRTGRPRRT